MLKTLSISAMFVFGALSLACSSSDTNKGASGSTPKVDLTIATVGIERATPTPTRTPAPTPEPATPTPTATPVPPPPPVATAAPSQPPASTGQPLASVPETQTGGAGQPQPAATAPRSNTPPTLAPPPVKLRIVALAPTSRGASASLRIVTTPGGSCFATYLPPGAAVTAVMNLAARSADSAGVISWTWAISTASLTGTGTVKVTCGAETVSQFLTIT